REQLPDHRHLAHVLARERGEADEGDEEERDAAEGHHGDLDETVHVESVPEGKRFPSSVARSAYLNPRNHAPPRREGPGRRTPNVESSRSIDVDQDGAALEGGRVRGERGSRLAVVVARDDRS